MTWPELELDDGAVALFFRPSELDPELADLDAPELPELELADPDPADADDPEVLVLLCAVVVACAASASE